MHRFGRSIGHSIRIRPKFEVKNSRAGSDLAQDILHQKSKYPNFELQSHASYIVLHITREHQHYWSPELHLTFSDDEVPTLIRGRYQPHPNVWTLFTLLYLAAILTLLAILLMGATKISLGIPTNALGLSLLPAAGIFGLYVASQIGQRLGHDQTEYLHEIMEKALDKNIPML